MIAGEDLPAPENGLVRRKKPCRSVPYQTLSATPLRSVGSQTKEKLIRDDSDSYSIATSKQRTRGFPTSADNDWPPYRRSPAFSIE